jgi:hypothetical protein
MVDLDTKVPDIRAKVGTQAVDQTAFLATAPTAATTPRVAGRRGRSRSDAGRDDQLIAFDSFDDRGRPLTGTWRDGVRVRYQYGPDGDVVIRYSTGLLLALDARGTRLWEQLPDGTRYSEFDRTGRPVAGTDRSGRRFTVGYGLQGEVILHPIDAADPQTIDPANVDRTAKQRRRKRDDRDGKSFGPPPVPSFGQDGLAPPMLGRGDALSADGPDDAVIGRRAMPGHPDRRPRHRRP